MPREHSGEFVSVDGHVSVDQRPFIKAVVLGSKHITRDFSEDAESILDPDGNRQYQREAQKGEWEEFMMCSSPTHKGERWLPFTQFSVDKSTPTKRNRYCLKCRADAEYERRVREAERRGVQLRGKAGRPPKQHK